MKSDDQKIDEVSLMFEAARSFIGGAKIIIDGDGIEENGVKKHPTLPVIVCSVIAVEIALKALLRLNGLPRPTGDGHDLKQLFEAHPDGLLQLLDTPAEGRLRDVHGLCRTAKVLQFRHRAKGLKVVEIELDRHGSAPVD